MDNCKKPSVIYTLFLYRQELKRTQKHYKRLNRTKLTLTDGLITKTLSSLKNCTADDLRALSREIKFKNQLKSELRRMNHLEKLGIKNPNPHGRITKL
ncbi:hypothetical protein FF38_04815 [Lucilia cuprina]|uniref:Uncharacterized protein n=1 Tax=Lucilia cuprina TaxID=7375 RepID=A0A0L0BKP3_LUCCU|nr:uncharacterized protein LOC111676929 [Lucilia cuprina]KNC20655.1 hypothetical protein FF38_04815 [Lucilia cuprina]